jgi:hypothetical protein
MPTSVHILDSIYRGQKELQNEVAGFTAICVLFPLPRLVGGVLGVKWCVGRVPKVERNSASIWPEGKSRRTEFQVIPVSGESDRKRSKEGSGLDSSGSSMGRVAGCNKQ